MVHLLQVAGSILQQYSLCCQLVDEVEIVKLLEDVSQYAAMVLQLLVFTHQCLIYLGQCLEIGCCCFTLADLVP